MIDHKLHFFSSAPYSSHLDARQRARLETVYGIEKDPVAAFLLRNEPCWPVEFVTRSVDRIFG
jgi:hypothetical protein